MAIVISGVNNNDKITASDGTIDLLSGVSYASTITAPAFTTLGNLTAGFLKGVGDAASGAFSQAAKTRAEEEKERREREFQIEILGKQQEFQTGEREAQQEFQTGERESQQEFQTGERASQQEFQKGERESQQEFQTGERESQQEFQKGERTAQEEFQRKEREKEEEFKKEQVDEARRIYGSGVVILPQGITGMNIATSKTGEDLPAPTYIMNVRIPDTGEEFPLTIAFGIGDTAKERNQSGMTVAVNTIRPYLSDLNTSGGLVIKLS